MKFVLFSILLFMTSCSYLPKFMQFSQDQDSMKIDIEKNEENVK